MSNEQERLIKLHNENKISTDDYKMLLSALNKKPSRAQLFFSFLINPFQKIAGVKALILGLIIMASMSYLGVIAKAYFPEVLGFLNSTVVKNPKFQLNFFLLAYQNIVCWLTMSALYIIAAKILQPKKTRIIDFLGTVALSRYPYLVFTILTSILVTLDPNFANVDLSHGYPMHNSMLKNIFAMLFVVCAAWHIATYFYAFKESSGLHGHKLWLSVIVALILGDTISGFLTRLLI